ncbi:hypothetical protein NDU88_008387 [Pleurodeles waltl]|uniref:Uncharacterized protein n=1 Tax=Pleurodeles waltl TaxID=8319 RepID=A0AAV7P0S1_PLEWA|nr:hypothetical protein NDU88_008387 [Pleurodeles waltl]
MLSHEPCFLLVTSLTFRHQHGMALLSYSILSQSFRYYLSLDKAQQIIFGTGKWTDVYCVDYMTWSSGRRITPPASLCGRKHGQIE